jgi:hypothetical protein
MTVYVCLVMLVQIMAAKVKRSDLPAIRFEPYAAQIAAHAQVKRPFKNIRGLNAGQYNHLLPSAAA